MADRELSVVAGALARGMKPKITPIQDAIAKRWRLGNLTSAPQTSEPSDVIPLLDGWIRLLEREAGSEGRPNAVRR
jgi:hypothetical protein